MYQINKGRNKKHLEISPAWWGNPVIPATGKHRQEDLELEPTPGSISSQANSSKESYLENIQH
jgi:hypothetical protein